MFWLKLILQTMALVPPVVHGIEAIHSHASGTTKKQLAMEALGLSTAVVQSYAPEHAQNIQVISDCASTMIDTVVTAANAVGAFDHKTPAAVAIPELSFAGSLTQPHDGQEEDAAAAVVVESPGLHNVVPA